MQLAYGTYAGNNTTQSITGTGFTPTAVFVWATTVDTANIVYKHSGLATNNSTFTTASVFITNGITSLDSGGFTVGAHDQVNNLGSNYAWVAIRGGAVTLDFASGTYTGNGSDNTNISGVGFQPDIVVVQKDSSPAVVWTVSKGGDATAYFHTTTGWQTDRIQGVHSDGFQVGTHADVNTGSTAYYYMCWKKRTGQVAEGTYTGDASDSRNIVQADAFQPDHVMVIDTATPRVFYRPPSASGDQTLVHGTAGYQANYIQGTNASGFQVGTFLNGNLKVFYYWSFKNGGADASPFTTDMLPHPEYIVPPTYGRWI